MRNSPRFQERRRKLITALAACVLWGNHHASAAFLEHWTTNQVSSQAGMFFVVFANSRYVAFGEYSDYGVVFSSDDGKTWALRSDGGPGPTSSGLSYSVGLCFTGNRFFALGGFGTSGVSMTGIDWTVFSFPNYATPAGVAYGATRYVAASDVGMAYGSDFNIATSSDGTVWTAQHSTSPNGAALSDIAYGAGKFVALGSAYGAVNDLGHSYTSTTGLTWTQRILPPGGSHITFARGIFIVPFSPGTNLVSVDGISWAVLGTGITNTLGKVLLANGIFMARTGPWLATSIDGTNWIRYPQPLPGSSYWDPNFATDGRRLVTPGATFTVPYYQGFMYYCDELSSLTITAAPPATLVISGLVGRTNRLEYINALPADATNSWQTLTNLRLDAWPTIVTDFSGTNAAQRFYRGYLLP